MTGDTKQHLRREFREIRGGFVRNLAPRARAEAFARLPEPLRARIEDAEVIAMYLAVGDEADPAAIAAFGRMSGKTICLPRLGAPGAAMEFAEWPDDDDELIDGPYGLAQPDHRARALNPDLIVTPLIAFDRRLSRLGQGKGYYDRAFASCPDAFRLGLAWSVQEAALIPVEPWDAALHAVLTELQMIEPIQ